MNRRRAVSLLAGAGCAGALSNGDAATFLVDVRTRRVIAASGAKRSAPPGSTVKPFVLAALLNRRKLSRDESLLCPGRLRIGNRMLDCSHPPIDTPMRVETAIAYSCNYFVAKMAERFEPGELSSELSRAGFVTRPAVNEDAQRAQALGEFGIATTVAELAFAYQRFAATLSHPEMEPILAGLESAVEFGTAQHARVAGERVAGKTGSTVNTAGEPVAWFAGLMPSRAPQVTVAVMLPGRSGGADAAPIAGRILEAYRAGRI